MRAICWRSSRFEFAELPRPIRRSSREVVVQVERISINRGELAFPWEPTRPAGWDAYGVVKEGSDDGEGPPVGTRVTTWGFASAWAEYGVVDRGNLAAVPADVCDVVAAAMPVAGLTALRSLRQLRLSAGARLAVTGASGGVGHLVLQLASELRLPISAIVHGQRGHDELRTRHPEIAPIVWAEPISALERLPLHDAIIDTVGGPLLSRLLTLLRSGGRVLLVGAASDAETLIDAGQIVSRRLNIEAFNDYSPAAADLSRLLHAVGEGRLRVHGRDAGDWSAIVAGRARSLVGRGKSTLRVGGAS